MHRNYFLTLLQRYRVDSAVQMHRLQLSTNPLHVNTDNWASGERERVRERERTSETAGENEGCRSAAHRNSSLYQRDWHNLPQREKETHTDTERVLHSPHESKTLSHRPKPHLCSVTTTTIVGRGRKMNSIPKKQKHLKGTVYLKMTFQSLFTHSHVIATWRMPKNKFRKMCWFLHAITMDESRSFQASKLT